jgi:hypothetical protein
LVWESAHGTIHRFLAMTGRIAKRGRGSKENLMNGVSFCQFTP